MPGPEVKVTVKFDNTSATKSIKDFTAESARSQKQIATDAKVGADALLKEAQAQESLSRAALSTARSSENLSRAKTIEAREINAATAATDKQTAALNRQAEAAAKAAVAAQNRQHRDEGSYIRQNRQVSEKRGQARENIANQGADNLMVGGAIVVGGLVAASIAGANFDATLVKIRNNTQMTSIQFVAMREHILLLGKQTGGSMTEMAEAFMRAQNHGFDLAESLKVVDAATKSALATGSDIGETGNVLAQTMHIFRLNADQASEAMNTLHMASLQGNTTMSELVQSFGLAEAVTSKYGLTLQDTAAVFATLTENGLNAAESGVQIRDALQHLSAASPKATAEIERLSKATGVDLVGDIDALRHGTGNLSKTMIDLSAATHGQAVEINKIIPAQRGAFGAMALSGKAADDLRKNYNELSDTMSGKLDPTTQGFTRQQKTLQAEIGRLKNTFVELSTKVGTTFVPMLDDAAKGVERGVDAFNKLDPVMQKGIVQSLAIAGFIALIGSAGIKAVTGVLALSRELKAAGLVFGGLESAAAGAAAAETATATAGAAAFATGGAWMLAVAAAVALVWTLKGAWDSVTDAQGKAARQKVLDNLDAAAAHRNDGNVDEQIKANKTSAGNILKSDDYKQVVAAIAPLKAEIASIRKGGVGAYEKEGASTSVALSEYDYALNNAKTLLASNVAAKAKYEADAKALLSDAARMAPDSQTTGVGMQIANAALARQTKDAHAFVHKCQSLARTTVEQVTHAYDGIWDRSPHASAKSNLARFQAAGLAQPYTPGMTLAPGSLLYSTTMGGDAGHVQTIGPQNQRLDQYGTDHFAEKNFQWFVPPPAGGRAVTPLSAKGGHISSFGDADNSAAKDAAAVLVEKAGLKADEAKRAFDEAKTAYERTNDVHYLVAATSIRREMLGRDISEAQATYKENNAGKDANKPKNAIEMQRKIEGYRAEAQKDIQALNDKLQGTVAERIKAGFDINIAGLSRQASAADTAVARLEKLAETSTSPTVLNALQHAYTTQANAKIAVSREQLQATLSTIPAGQTAARHAAAAAESNEELRTTVELQDKLATLTEHRAQMEQRLLDIQTQQNTAQRALLDAKLGAATTDADKERLRQQVHTNELTGLTLDLNQTLSKLSEKYQPLIAQAPKGPERAGIQAEYAGAQKKAEDAYNGAKDAANVRFGGEEVQAANAQIQQRADHLRTEAQLTDDVSVKMSKLAAAYNLIIGITPEQDDRDLLARQRDQEQHGLRREQTDQTGQTQLATGILAGSLPQINAALDTLKGLITDPQATRDEQKSSRGEYLSELTDLVRDRNLDGRAALGRVVDPDTRKTLTPGEIAAASSAARQILDTMLTQDFARIALIKNPAQRKTALDTLQHDINTDPVYQQAGVVQYGTQTIRAKMPELLRKDGAVDQFYNEFAQGAGQAGSNILRNMLNPKDRQGLFKSFWADLEGAGESALSNMLQKEMQHGAEKLFQSGFDGLFSFGSHAAAGAATSAGASAAGTAASTAASAATSVATDAASGAAAGAAGGAATGAATSAAGGAFASMSTIAPYLAAVAVLSNPQVEKAITDYISTTAKAVATVVDSIGKEAAAVIGAYGKAIAAVVGAVGKGIQSIEEGVGSLAKGVGEGIGSAASGVGKGIHSILSGITGADAMRVQTMNVAQMNHAIVLGGGAGMGGGGGLLGGIIGGIGKLLHFADGGLVPGSGYGDSVPALLTPGEMVIPRGAMNLPAPRSFTVSAPSGSLGGAAPAAPSAGGSPPHITQTVNVHNPVYNNDLDLDRANESNARLLKTAFTLG